MAPKAGTRTPPSIGVLLTDPLLLLWTAVCIVTAPVLLLLKLRRYLRNRFEFEFDPARWHVAPITAENLKKIRQSDAVHVVFVGGGIGELQMIDRIAKELAATRPEIQVTYCFRDPTTLNLLKEQRQDLNVAIWPFDFLIPVAKWLAHQQPDVLVFTERFRFTTFSCAAARLGANVALMNGRCRPRNSAIHALFGFIYRWQFGAFRVMAMQRQDYFERAQRFVTKPTKLILTGDIKADLSPVQLKQQQIEEIRSWLGESPLPLLAAGSTETAEEEQMVIEAFKTVRQKIPCRLVIAPRKIARRDETCAVTSNAGLRASLRTSPCGEADVFVLDTLGELRHVYSLCALAYVGGAYGKGGGHNVMEPLEWGVPVSYGMTRGYFEALQRACEAQGVGTRIRSSEDLAQHWLSLLQNTQEREELAQRAAWLLERSRGAVQKTVDLLSELTDDKASARELALQQSLESKPAY